MGEELHEQLLQAVLRKIGRQLKGCRQTQWWQAAVFVKGRNLRLLRHLVFAGAHLQWCRQLVNFQLLQLWLQMDRVDETLAADTGDQLRRAGGVHQ